MAERLEGRFHQSSRDMRPALGSKEMLGVIDEDNLFLGNLPDAFDPLNGEFIFVSIHMTEPPRSCTNSPTVTIFRLLHSIKQRLTGVAPTRGELVDDLSICTLFRKSSRILLRRLPCIFWRK